MRARIWRIVILAGLVPLCAAAEDFPFNKFERSTLGEITGTWDRSMADPAGAERKARLRFYNEGPILRRVVRARYLGDHRTVDAELAKFLDDFEKMHSITIGNAGLYKDEYLFEEAGGKQYWLPVQTQVASFFASELHPGDTLDLYLIAEGGIWKPDSVRYVLAVEEFEAIAETH